MAENHLPPNLNLRYQIEVCFPEEDEPDEWDTITSFHSPRDALHRCSECLESVKDLLLGMSSSEKGETYVQIRIWDAKRKAHVLWEDQNGALHASPRFVKELTARGGIKNRRDS